MGSTELPLELDDRDDSGDEEGDERGEAERERGGERPDEGGDERETGHPLRSIRSQYSHLNIDANLRNCSSLSLPCLNVIGS